MSWYAMTAAIRRVRTLGIWLTRTRPAVPRQIVDRATALELEAQPWEDARVAERQDRAYRDLLAQMHAGAARADLKVAARAVEFTRLDHPRLLEVGCGSAYYAEVLPVLTGHAIGYTGLDRSRAMVLLGRAHYPTVPLVQADAACLPFRSNSFDVVLNGVSLMHVLAFSDAIAESARVARTWCIFHTVPLVRERPTTVLRKLAYGKPAIEIIFNEGELDTLLSDAGLMVRQRLDSIPYDLSSSLGEVTFTQTLVCEKVSPRP